jgi:hypothetical protein
MSTFLKHVGILKNTSKRVVIIFHEIPGTSDRALVCDMEALPPRMHDAVMSIVESQEAQRGEIKDIYELLSRRLFPDTGLPVINELHNRGYLQPVAQNNVMVMPRPNVQIPLDVLVSEIRRLNPNKKAEMPVGLEIPADLPPNVRQAMMEAQRQLMTTTTEVESIETNVDVETAVTNEPAVATPKHTNADLPPEVVERFNQHLHNQNASKVESRVALAQSILKQAQMLSQEANALVKKALSMAPELDPNATPEQAKVQTIVTRDKVLTNSDVTKAKSPGRPRRQARAAT